MSLLPWKLTSGLSPLYILPRLSSDLLWQARHLVPKNKSDESFSDEKHFRRMTLFRVKKNPLTKEGQRVNFINCSGQTSPSSAVTLFPLPTIKHTVMQKKNFMSLLTSFVFFWADSIFCDFVETSFADGHIVNTLVNK